MEDDRQARLDRLRVDLKATAAMSNTTTAAASVARLHAEATVELVEAVRDLAALVALAVTPPHYRNAIVDESDAQSAGGADEPERTQTLADYLDVLTAGDVVNFVGGSTLEVLGAGISEGSGWFEVSQTGDGGTPRRVWEDDLAKDETPVEHVEGATVDEPTIVARHEKIDADADDAAWPDDEEGESDDFDTVV